MYLTPPPYSRVAGAVRAITVAVVNLRLLLYLVQRRLGRERVLHGCAPCWPFVALLFAARAANAAGQAAFGLCGDRCFLRAFFAELLVALWLRAVCSTLLCADAKRAMRARFCRRLKTK